ncbi:galactosyldiacylglycerol synthase [candidate division KSB1 bacterium]|nr:galactosyldiacylglycerol synthase [candidate division KSB1 bacterium]
MIQLKDKETGTLLGSISQQQLQFLIDNLEEEYKEDMDYYLNAATLDMLESRGADQGLLKLLRQALGDREGVEIVWLKK